METQISATVGMDSYLCLTLFFFSSAARILDTCGELSHGIYGAFFCLHIHGTVVCRIRMIIVVAYGKAERLASRLGGAY